MIIILHSSKQIKQKQINSFINFAGHHYHRHHQPRNHTFMKECPSLVSIKLFHDFIK